MLGLNELYKGLYLFLTKGTWKVENKKGEQYLVNWKGARTRRTTEIWNEYWAHNHTKSNVEAHWNSKEKKLANAESTSSNALSWIVLDLDIWVRFG